MKGKLPGLALHELLKRHARVWALKAQEQKVLKTLFSLLCIALLEDRTEKDTENILFST